jgi:hypothetical protein
MTPPTHGLTDVMYGCAYLAIMVVVGHAAVSAVLPRGRRHWAEAGGLSFAAGAGLTSLWLMLASLAGSPPSRGVLAAWAAVAAAAAAGVLWRRGQLLMPDVPGRFRRPDAASVVGALALVAVLAAATNVWAETSTRGLGDVDEYAIWMLRAKQLAAAPLRPVPAALLAPGLSYSHQDYPLLLPLLAAGAYAAVGRVDEPAAKMLLLPMYLSLVGVVYGAARRGNRRALALAVTALVAAAPVVVEKAGLAVGELPVTLYLAATTSLVVRWTQRQERGDLVLAGGLAAAAAFSKNEGLAMLPVFAVAALAYAVARRADRRRLSVDWALAATAALVLVSPWLAYRRGLPHTHEDYGGKFATVATVVHGVGRLPEVLVSVVRSMLDLTTAGGVWVVLAVVAGLGRRALLGGPTRVLWAVLLGQLGLYVAAFMVTPWDLRVLLDMVTSKLLAQAAPAAAMLIALHLPAVPGGAPEIK